jgi:hypothetical protein
VTFKDPVTNQRWLDLVTGFISPGWVTPPSPTYKPVLGGSEQHLFSFYWCTDLQCTVRLLLKNLCTWVTHTPSRCRKFPSPQKVSLYPPRRLKFNHHRLIFLFYTFIGYRCPLFCWSSFVSFGLMILLYHWQ